MKVLVKKLHQEARIPRFNHLGDAGADLCCVEDLIIHPGETKSVRTGLAMAIPLGFEGQIRPRSGLALEGLTVLNSPGTIDSGFRGEIMLMLTNLGPEAQCFAPGDRLAQLCIRRIPPVDFIIVDELDGTERGSGGFGSTGMQ
jgi:dUTP pyrophosphatase